ncbi:MAG TPA: alpha/beta hydrolase domain-containing protein [Acidimicrobiales bacterium]|nr:alpha/beta hydrolase domain-containing protein [Acidimicrobiales bacterium]
MRETEQHRNRRRVRTALGASVLAVMAAAPLAGVTPAARAGTPAVPPADLSGPVTGGIHGRPFGSSVINLASWGYREDEYFASGTAQNMGSASNPAPTSGTAPYVTRLLVRRPSNPARFNGTVLVEWFNVSSSQDYDADWSEGYREILRGGYVYVGVSVQQAGATSTKNWDPVRYASLRHPGDGYADSMYAQILAAVRHPRGVNPLAGLSVRHVIADGHSQSGIDLHAFVDTVQKATPVADGFLIRGDSLTKFDFSHLRTPVLQYQSEQEMDGPVARLQQEGTYAPPASDSAFYRLWQVAGATHTGQEGSDYLEAELGRDYATNQQPGWDETTEGRYGGSAVGTCVSSIGVGGLDQFPQWYTLDAAIHALNQWVTTGRAPAPAPRIGADASGVPVRDSHGNAVGGVRDPVVDVPIATYHGDEGCPLSGVSIPLGAATLKALYPTEASYVAQVRKAAGRDRSAGWLTGYDAADLIGRAQKVSLPG